MRTRFTINDRGELADRDGIVLGRIVALTLEHPGGGDIGGAVEPSNKDKEKTPRKPPWDERVELVWRHYTATFGSRFQLNQRRERDILNALKVRSIEDCCRAITGLSRSPHHNGQNDQGTKYLDIRYALRGNGAKGESHEERIDRMAALAALPPLKTEPKRGAQTQARIDDAKRALMRGAEGALSRDLVAYLAHHGIAVSFRPDGFPVFEEQA